MLTTAVRRAASLTLSQHAEEARQFIDLLAKQSIAATTVEPRKPKIINETADGNRKVRVKPEEQPLSWWLDHRKPGYIFQADDEHRIPDRTAVLERVRSVVRKHYGMDFVVKTFGSVKYGATSANSDMDLIIIDTQRMSGFDPSKKRLPWVYQMKTLAGQLKHEGFTGVQTIPASVPIVKFKDPKTGIQCDINVNDQPGYWNSIMLKRYADLCPHLPRLLLAIKRWSRPIGLNNPSRATIGTPISFSSYAFALMTVGFLQHRGLLPNLQENMGPDIRFRYFWNRKPVYRCDMRFKWYVLPMQANAEVSTPALFMDWFKFWAEFDAGKQMVDICQGGVVATANEGGYPLYVMDPFIRVRNVAQNISKDVLARFQEECRAANTELRERSERGGYVIV